MPTPICATPPVSSIYTKKRARKDALDENGDGGDAGGRLPRVRQRLVSTSSVDTIRPHKSIGNVRGIKGSSITRSCVSTDSKGLSDESPKVRPLSEINHIPEIRLNAHSGELGPSTSLQRTGWRALTLILNNHESPPLRVGSLPPLRVVVQILQTTLDLPTSLDRFDLRIKPVKMHTDLWDLSDDSLHAWPGILVLTDNKGSVKFPPIHAVDVECATYAYEGRFSTETNAVPVFSTHFQGACFSQKELAEVFDPSLGIVMQEDWSDAQDRKNQWYIKFWVPIPIYLFSKKDSRMFRLRATASVVDDRVWKKVTVYSGTVVADISHLQKHKDMDGTAARA
ncbi:hypothetical protein B0F90DRAFT_957879 [Multifurca ochricompacta]|uniref:Uncharacterized protein n=1 Tax=Multifurca ochricompacta TaxID=376703 RepID=A0AAD4MBC5_9AGAM|nr:hypothetical protein B0F90DRAFT_957879 [Multifurca ochricompacta]